MLTIKDCLGHVVCKANTTTGVIEMKYKKIKMSSVLPVGGSCIVERDNCCHLVARISGKSAELLDGQDATP